MDKLNLKGLKVEIEHLDKNRILLEIKEFDFEAQIINKDFFTLFIAEISRNYKSSSFDTDMLSKALSVSRSQLYRHCRKIIKSNPKKFLNEFRLSKAKTLIANGARINLVADQVGFNSHSYFCKCFKQKYGYKPSEIRGSNEY